VRVFAQGRPSSGEVWCEVVKSSTAAGRARNASTRNAKPPTFSPRSLPARCPVVVSAAHPASRQERHRTGSRPLAFCLAALPGCVACICLLFARLFACPFRPLRLTGLVLGKSLNYGILPDPNPNPAFTRIRANPDPDPCTLGFILDHLAFATK
jgi:hypothetical protein